MRQPRRPRPRPKPRIERKIRPTKPASVPENLLELIISVLGKSEDSEEFTAVMNALGIPSRKYDVGEHRFFKYWEYGLSISYDTQANRFYGVGLHIDTAGVRSGGILKYEGRLPAEIEATDSCLDVEKKLGRTPEGSNWVRGCDGGSCDPQSARPSYWQKYLLPPYEYTVIFRSEQGGLRMLGINFR